MSTPPRTPHDTLHGLPPPPLMPTIETEIDFRQTVVDAMKPIRSMWDRRSEDMLAVLAQSTAAQVQVREAVRTIRICAWCGVLAILLVGFSMWQVLDHDRAELRRLRELDRFESTKQIEDLVRRTSRACRQ